MYVNFWNVGMKDFCSLVAQLHIKIWAITPYIIPSTGLFQEIVRLADPEDINMRFSSSVQMYANVFYFL